MEEKEIEIITNELDREKSKVKEYGTRLLKAIEYNEHLIRDTKYRLNIGHLKKMRKILKGEDKK